VTNGPHRFGNRWRPRALAVVLAVAALLVAGATAAQAHDILVGTSPVDGSTAKVVPARVTLTFDQPALAVGTEILVTGPAGQVQRGAAVLVDNIVIEHLQPGSPAGRYAVIWRVTSNDGHPVSGRFSFTATSPSPGQQLTSTTSRPPTPAGVSGQSHVLRWVWAGSALLLMLLAVFIFTRNPRTSLYDEGDPKS